LVNPRRDVGPLVADAVLGPENLELLRSRSGGEQAYHERDGQTAPQALSELHLVSFPAHRSDPPTLHLVPRQDARRPTIIVHSGPRWRAFQSLPRNGSGAYGRSCHAARSPHVGASVVLIGPHERRLLVVLQQVAGRAGPQILEAAQRLVDRRL